MKRAQADPVPCERCGHRRDMHEVFGGLRRCRACDWAAVQSRCSIAQLRREAILEALSFEREEDV